MTAIRRHNRAGYRLLVLTTLCLAAPATCLAQASSYPLLLPTLPTVASAGTATLPQLSPPSLTPSLPSVPSAPRVEPQKATSAPPG